jgi:type II secretory pathway component PulK
MIRKRKAVVLLTALWIVALLGFLLSSIVHRVRLEMLLATYERDATTARALLDSGWARALAAIRQDGDDELDFPGESWGTPADMREEKLLPAESLVGETPVRWRVTDEGSKININTADRKIIEQVLTAHFGASVNARELAGAIIDWTDADDNGAAESDFYSTRKFPHGARNSAITFLDELNAIDGVTVALFAGEDANGNGLVDPNENDGARLSPEDNADGELQPALTELFTIWGDGAINVNTTPEKTLSAVFAGVVDPAEAAKLARAIAERRSGPDAISGTMDDTPFRSASEIAEIIGAPNYEKCKTLGARLGVASEAFSVRVDVDIETTRMRMRGNGLVLRDRGELRIAYWRPVETLR